MAHQPRYKTTCCTHIHGLHPHIVALQHEHPSTLDHALVLGSSIEEGLDGWGAVGHGVVAPAVTLGLEGLSMEGRNLYGNIVN